MLLLKMWSLFEGSQNVSCAREGKSHPVEREVQRAMAPGGREDQLIWREAGSPWG